MCQQRAGAFFFLQMQMLQDRRTKAQISAAQTTINQHKHKQNGCNDTPQSVHYTSIAPKAQKSVGCSDPVGIRFAGVAEKRIRDPDLSHHVAV